MKNNVLQLSLITLCIVTASASAAERYEVIDLGVVDSSPTFGFEINNNNLLTGYSTLVREVESVDADNNPVTINQAFSHAVSYSDLDNALTDLGAIDNQNVLVEITNIVDGETVTETVNVGAEHTLSFGLSINDSNTVAGYSTELLGNVFTTETVDEDGNEITIETAVAIGVERAIYMDASAGPINLVPHFDQDNPLSMRAISISESGEIVGFGRFNPEEDVNTDGDPIDVFYDRGFIFDPANPDSVLMVSPADNISGQAVSMRDIENGRAVGWIGEPVFDFNGNVVSLVNAKSFYVDVNAPQTLNNLNMVNDDNDLIELGNFPYAINRAGKIVGRAVNDSNKTVAFMYDIDSTKAIDLGVLNVNSYYAEAFDINDPVDTEAQGEFQVVGLSSINTVNNTTHAFLYEKGEIKDLNNFIDCKLDPNAALTEVPDVELFEARSINDSGHILANGVIVEEYEIDGEVVRSPVIHSFLLKPKNDRQPIACLVETDDDSGSGSLPFSGLLLLISVIFLTRKLN